MSVRVCVIHVTQVPATERGVDSGAASDVYRRQLYCVLLYTLAGDEERRGVSTQVTGCTQVTCTSITGIRYCYLIKG